MTISQINKIVVWALFYPMQPYPFHQKYGFEALQLVKNLNVERTGTGIQLLRAVNFLKDWLINHINGTDKEYSSFLISKGVK